MLVDLSKGSATTWVPLYKGDVAPASSMGAPFILLTPFHLSDLHHTTHIKC